VPSGCGRCARRLRWRLCQEAAGDAGAECGAECGDGAQAAGPGEIAAAIATEIGRVVDYEPVATDGAARAARLLAELL
jgi:hypothetical protein